MIKRLDPNSIGYTNALLEEMRDEIKVIHECVQPIPEMQEDIRDLKSRMGNVEVGISALKGAVGTLQTDVGDLRKQTHNLQEQVGSMEPTLNATFDEVGKLRVDVEQFKETQKSH